jgi:prepilin-type N-terminal cleavage/methylation domain-containing protein
MGSWKSRGVTLIELLISLVLSSLLIGALYRTFISQQKTYTVQEQVADMQQNVRVAINRMMREIRMTSFGSVAEVLGTPGGVNGFSEVIIPNKNQITIVGGFRQIKRENGDPVSILSTFGKEVRLNYSTDDFDGAAHRYISIGGIESNTVRTREGSTLTLDKPVRLNHPVGTPIFKIQAITYDLGQSGGKKALRRNENTGGGRQPFAENIDDVEFEYFDADGNTTPVPMAIRVVKVSVTAKTEVFDPDFKGGDGYRRRTVSSCIQLRNMGLTP